MVDVINQYQLVYLFHNLQTLYLFDYFDLTIGSENYKKDYSNRKLNSALFLKSKSLKGFIYIFLVKIKLIIKKILENNDF